MSAEELSKLSLGDNMVTTRAGAARARTAPPIQSTQHQSPSPSTSKASSPTPSLVESKNNLHYNVSIFDEEMRKRAKRGLMDDNDIKMKYCAMEEGEPTEYLFHIDDDITIAVGGRYTAPKCSCGANESGKACKHIFWLGDQIISGAPERIKKQTLELAEDGSTIQNIRPAEMIKNMGIEEVADGLGWVLQEEELPEEEEMKDEITEMLSVFEPTDQLPAEFKYPDSPGASIPEERSRKYREFTDLFTEYAMRNHGLLIQLRDLIDPAFQAHVFFDKINDRIDRAFKALEEYMTYGPTNAPSEALDVPNCAARLKGVAKAVDDYYRQQDEDGSETKDIAIRTAASLVTILDGVVRRNYDAYANITWGGIPPTNPAENNLFICLIGAAPESEGLFVLDALQALPQEDVLRNHWETLHNIGESLSREPWTPPTYLSAFRAMTQESRKRAASETGGSEAKRPMQ